MKNKKQLPNFQYEKKLWQQGYSVIGIDEVGLGALSGPIYICCFCLQPQLTMQLINTLQALKIDDSKELTAKKRKFITTKIKDIVRTFAIESSPVEYINKHGIVQAMEDAVCRALKITR